MCLCDGHHRIKNKEYLSKLRTVNLNSDDAVVVVDFFVQHLLLLPFEASMKYKQQKKPSVEKQVQKSSIRSNKVFKYRHSDGMDERIDDGDDTHTHAHT